MNNQKQQNTNHCVVANNRHHNGYARVPTIFDLFSRFFRESVESTEKYITIFFRCFLYLSSNSSKSIPDPEKEIIQVSKTISKPL